jgi:hypothetical protein
MELDAGYPIFIAIYPLQGFNSAVKLAFCQSTPCLKPLNDGLDMVNGLEQIHINRMFPDNRHCLILLDKHFTFCFLQFKILSVTVEKRMLI